MNNPGITRRQVIVGGAAILGAGLLAACGTDTKTTTSGPTTTGGSGGGSSTPASSTATAGTGPSSGGTLRIAASGGGAQDSLDPNLAADDPAIIRVNNLYETLSKMNLDYKLENLLADSFEASEGGKVWTVRLVDGVTFHHGKPLTADDLMASFRRVFSEESPAVIAATLDFIDLGAMKKMDDRTVRFTLKHPVGPFAMLTSQVAIVPEDFDPKTAIGTGPFKLESFTPGDRSMFSRNENYWRRAAYLDSLETIDFADPTAGVNALLGKQVDLLSSVPTSQTKAIESGGAQLLLGDGGRPLLFDMNQAGAPFKDEKVRQAFRLIVDREQMLQQAMAGYGTVGNDLYSPWDEAYDHDIPQREQDLDQAKSLLKQAGAENLTVDLPTTPAVSGLVEMCLVFKEQAKAAGVTVNVMQQDPGKFWGESFGNSDFQPDFLANLPYLQSSGQYQLPGAPFNAAHADDPEFIDLYQQAIAEQDDAKRIDIEHQMQQIQWDRGAYILPVHSQTIDAFNTNVGGLVQNAKVTMPMNNADFYDVYVG